MNLMRIVLFFPFIFTLVRASLEAPESADQVSSNGQSQEQVQQQTQRAQEVAATMSQGVHAQYPHIKLPSLEELTVVRQKNSFVARKYKNYDTTTFTPALKNETPVVT